MPSTRGASGYLSYYRLFTWKKVLSLATGIMVSLTNKGYNNCAHDVHNVHSLYQELI